MLKKLILIPTIMLTACILTSNEGKTPRTTVGQLNGCMLNQTYDLQAQGKLFERDKWSVARDIMNSCQRQLHLSSSEINEKQSMNIVVSVIDSLR